MKNQIRNEIKEKIKNIPSAKKEEYSFCITQKIIEKFGHLDNRHIYRDMADEVSTKELISHLQQAGKKIFFPDDDIVEMLRQNISYDIIIIPGRAFTRDNKRLGRGAGYYDRFLAHHPYAKKIGVCFPEQIVDDILQETHDILMDEIITD